MHYNMAECHDRLGHYREAAAELRAYLAAFPNADDRASVERRIATFDERVKRADAEAAAKRAEEARRAEEAKKAEEARKAAAAAAPVPVPAPAPVPVAVPV